jgi:hypothetical protein
MLIKPGSENKDILLAISLKNDEYYLALFLLSKMKQLRKLFKL